MKNSMVPCAMWSDDCQGKKDYDGRLLSISTRYWPGPDGGGFTVLNPSNGTFSTRPYGKRPSASASIVLNHGLPDKPDGFDDYVVWREQEFEADTEAEVRALVEAWVKEQFDAVCRLLGIAVPPANGG